MFGGGVVVFDARQFVLVIVVRQSVAEFMEGEGGLELPTNTSSKTSASATRSTGILFAVALKVEVDWGVTLPLEENHRLPPPSSGPRGSFGHRPCRHRPRCPHSHRHPCPCCHQSHCPCRGLCRCHPSNGSSPLVRRCRRRCCLLCIGLIVTSSCQPKPKLPPLIVAAAVIVAIAS